MLREIHFEHAFGIFNAFVVEATAVLIVLFFLFGLDDFFIDLCAFLFEASPELLTPEELLSLDQLPQKRIAVLVAAWKEDGVLKNMIRGNSKSIQYNNYSFFIGVYPNDTATLKEALEAAEEFPNVHVVINPLDGPTCKGQMLNVLVREILFREDITNSLDDGSQSQYDAFIIHDSEDLIHRLEFQLVNQELDTHDFVQVPIFSLPLAARALVAGVYIDEFAEGHTKLVLVRNRLGAAIPSAGVGTALSRKLVLTYMRTSSGDLLHTKSLTEDYELGLSTKRKGFASKFCCRYIQTPDGQKEYIATRGYFPKAFWPSIRQKSRWTLGIAFQGFENLGWEGDLVDRYFLFRDRKGPVCNFLVAIAFLLFFYSLSQEVAHPGFLAQLTPSRTLQALVLFNSFFMINRIIQRMWNVQKLYGWKLASLSPLRWPIANVVGLFATFFALKQYIKGKLSGTAPRWIKTEHELPVGFGDVSLVTSMTSLEKMTDVILPIYDEAKPDREFTLSQQDFEFQPESGAIFSSPLPPSGSLYTTYSEPHHEQGSYSEKNQM